MHYIDVGQGDSILVQLPGGGNILIDAGNNDDADLVVNYLRRQGVKRLEYVIGTHPHEDHIGGLDGVIHAFDIEEIYMPRLHRGTDPFWEIQEGGLSMIRFVEMADYNAWLDLAKEVEPLFGEMVTNTEFQNGIKQCISDSSALCIVNDCNIEGIIAVNKINNEISWLAVRKESRGKGYGYQLVEKALYYLNDKKPVFVQTFSPQIKVGEMARRMYLKFGFRDFRDGGKNPAGIDTVIMKLEK